LTDDKNTRWLCFYIEDVDWRGYSKNVDIHKVWAQAWHLYHQLDYQFDLTQDESFKRDLINEEYKVEDFETAILKKYFCKSPTDFMTNAEIMIEIGKIVEGKLRLTTTSQKIGRVLSELGYERFRAGGIRGWKIGMRQTPIGNKTNGDLTLNINSDDDLPF
jgi:predicted P-loop ATPase